MTRASTSRASFLAVSAALAVSRMPMIRGSTSRARFLAVSAGLAVSRMPMTRSSTSRAGVLAVAAALALTGCDAPPAPAAPAISCVPGSTAGQGSSAQANALNAWIKDYQIACPDATVAYTSSGSGAGVRAFLSGVGDFVGTDSPLSSADQRRADARCGGPAVHLPLVIGPIALAYNLAGAGELRLTPQTIARIFSGAVTLWNDPAIAADNPATALPATPIRTIHRSDSSGTTDSFTRYLSVAAGPAWSHGSGSDWSAPGGTGLRGSSRVAAAVTRTDGAIGYVEASYARVNDLTTVAVGSEGTGFAPPTDYASARAVESARITGTGGDLRLEIDHRGAAYGTYPLVVVTYQVACRTGTSAPARGFLAYAAGEAGQAAVEGAGYAPLPEAVRSRVAQAVADLR